MIGHVIILLGILLPFSSSQLIGSRGVITLKEGVEYRDPETVEASEVVARYAQEYQKVDDQIAERRSQTNNFQPLRNEITPKFQTLQPNHVKGRPLVENEIFDFLDTRFVEPPSELQFNKFLDQIEIERATSPIRLLPGEGLPPTSPPPTRPPGRLVNLKSPSLGLKQSVRAENAQFSTIFGLPSKKAENTFPVLKRPRINPQKNIFSEKSSPSSGHKFVPPPGIQQLTSLSPSSEVSEHVIRPFVNLNDALMFVSLSEPASLGNTEPVNADPLNSAVTSGSLISVHGHVGLPSVPFQQVFNNNLHQETSNTDLLFPPNIEISGVANRLHPDNNYVASNQETNVYIPSQQSFIIPDNEFNWVGSSGAKDWSEYDYSNGVNGAVQGDWTEQELGQYTLGPVQSVAEGPHHSVTIHHLQ